VPLQAGFVGCGNITDTHARAAREAGLGIAAFFGRDLAKAEAMAARHGGRAFERYDDFLAHRPMDLVVVGSPSGLHAEQGIAAAQRGLHVLVE
jgi:predicted dehydrogenase